MLRWLVLDLNSFFASCEQQEHPELRGKPVIVVPTMAETTCAIAASYPAKAFGIKTGTLVHEARRLCPDVQLVQAHHKLYVEYHLGAKAPGFMHERAGLDAERLRRVAGGDGAGRFRDRGHDDHGLAAQRRIFLLLAGSKKAVEIKNEPAQQPGPPWPG